MVLGAEVGGRWNGGAQRLLRDLVRLRSQRAPPALRRAAMSAWARRWSGMLAVAVQQAVAGTALGAWGFLLRSGSRRRPTGLCRQDAHSVSRSLGVVARQGTAVKARSRSMATAPPPGGPGCAKLARLKAHFRYGMLRAFDSRVKAPCDATAGSVRSSSSFVDVATHIQTRWTELENQRMRIQSRKCAPGDAMFLIALA